LLLALGVVVIYTSRPAFFSPLAIVVVAAIGLAALLLQLRLRRDLNAPVHAPLWLNVLGLLFAVAAVFADVLHLSSTLMLIATLGAVICFSTSSARSRGGSLGFIHDRSMSWASTELAPEIIPTAAMRERRKKEPRLRLFIISKRRPYCDGDDKGSRSPLKT